jgi:translin
MSNETSNRAQLSLSESLTSRFAEIDSELADINAAREVGLKNSRDAIRFCSRSIRALHRGEFELADSIANEARTTLEQAQQRLASVEQMKNVGFLLDAEKEYAEAKILRALVTGNEIPTHQELHIASSAWLNGLAEAASEMRRSLLDRLRSGELDECEQMLVAMDEIYELLIRIDYPDAITGGLRRTTDAYRAVLERTRSDFTTTVLQERLRHALQSANVPE